MNHFTRLKHLATVHHQKAAESFHRTHRHAKRLLHKHKVVLHSIREHAVRTTAVATLSSSLIAAPVAASVSVPANNQTNAPSVRSQQLEKEVMEEYLKTATPKEVSVAQILPTTSTPAVPTVTRPTVPERIQQIAPTTSPLMTGDQEVAISQMIKDYYGIDATAELDGIRLNAVRGVIAGEQHLPLYPGDSLANHRSDPTANWTGMVPGLPAWGYMAPNRASVTQKDIERERYYIAAQTFLAPGWDQNMEKMYQWFKYRKMIMINTKTGQAVVVDIADSGPNPHLKSTVDGVRRNRTFGGSNEVLIGLGFGLTRVGDVIAFFVNDPNDSIPLGPISIRQ